MSLGTVRAKLAEGRARTRTRTAVNRSGSIDDGTSQSLGDDRCASRRNAYSRVTLAKHPASGQNRFLPQFVSHLLSPSSAKARSAD